MENKKININAFFFLRFLAIFIIVLHHLPPAVNWQPKGGFGDIGTSFFFVLSGFVLPLGYSRFVGIKDIYSFLKKRVIKLYPIHLITLLAGILLYVINKWPVPTQQLFANLFLLQSWFSQKSFFFSFNALSWFLSSLIFCYIIFAVVLTNPKILYPFALLFSVVSIVLSFVYLGNIPSAEKTEKTLFLFHVFPPNRLFNFLFGMGASYVFIRFIRNLSYKISPSIFFVLEFIIIALIADHLCSKILVSYLYQYIAKLYVSGTGLALFYFTSNYIYFPIVSILLLFIIGCERGPISKMMQTPDLIKLGELSFCIYMSHQLIFNFFGIWQTGLLNALGKPMTGVTVFFFVIVLSSLMSKYIEKPINGE
ncbi:MAG: acyltransferase [Desulfobacterales bacterium]|nr:acyltransferase [Desulfobacterales bacterium]